MTDGTASSFFSTGYHAPVMVSEVLEYLQPELGGTFFDGTLGGGGHSQAILEAGPNARVIATDRDPDALVEAGTRLERFGDRVRLVRSNFSDGIAAAGIAPGSMQGALLDLGVSSHQLDVRERGFTFREGADLDMRMARGSAEEPTAADLLNTLDEAELAHLFRRYGEEPRARRLAQIVAEMREEAPFQSSDQLVDAVRRALGPRSDIKDRARIFQALRIAVNREIEALENVLPQLRESLVPGGVLVVLSYHSLEDRVVKDAFRDWSQSCVCPPGFPICHCRGAPLGTTLTRKPRSATDEEIQVNPRARSARLRAWRKQ